MQQADKADAELCCDNFVTEGQFSRQAGSWQLVKHTTPKAACPVRD